MMINIDFEKKRNVIIAISVICMVIFVGMIFVYIPLLNEVRGLKYSLEKVNKDIQIAENLLNARNENFRELQLLSEEQVVVILDEITRAGKDAQVKFLSIVPGKRELVDKMPYDLLPIQMSVQAQYKNFGVFLNKLYSLKKSSVVVENFYIERDEQLLPELKSNLTLGVFLKNE